MKKVIRSVWILVSLWLVLAYVGGALPGPARTVKRRRSARCRVREAAERGRRHSAGEPV